MRPFQASVKTFPCAMPCHAMPVWPEWAPDVAGAQEAWQRPSRAASDDDRLFEERLREVRRQAEEKKRAKAVQSTAAIDYDNPQTEPLVDTAELTKDLPTKIGIGIAATVFAAIFAFGDILPAPSPPKQQQVVDASGIAVGKMTDAQRKQREDQLKEFEGRLAATPDNREALEGAAVLYAELGQYGQAAQRLEQLSQACSSKALEGAAVLYAELGQYGQAAQRLEQLSQARGQNRDPGVQRLLGEVRFELGEYGASAAAYRRAIKAVDELLAARQRVAAAAAAAAVGGEEAAEQEGVADEVQVALLLGKAYAAWGRPGDAAAVYDGLIASRPDDFRGYLAKVCLYKMAFSMLLGKAYAAWGRPGDAAAVYGRLIASRNDDFRGYLAKGLFLKDNGNQAEADRMFLQARYLAPDQVKVLVDRLAKR
ncbi:unnamed protein product [Closterium sp. Yama58-4]|nr:unnamed protein product [Closterium sp. Yama58-4]